MRKRLGTGELVVDMRGAREAHLHEGPKFEGVLWTKITIIYKS